jgi:ABC-type dipeptide/oligopeptide/nickel transport system ATPase component
LLKLIPKPGRILEGEAIFNGVDLLKASSETLRSVRGSKISMVFQEPATSLDPVFTIGEQLTEALAAHRILKGGMADRDICMEHLAKVHIADPKKVYYDYPHQLSGGTKQRVMIAMALLNSPELLILDEPTTALDVTIQAQILDTLIEIEKREGLSTLFISHDLGIIAKMCRRIAVMRKGRIVETGDRDEIFFKPGNPYTISLLESVKALL